MSYFFLIPLPCRADISLGGTMQPPKARFFVRGGPAMTAQRRKEIMGHIEELKTKLEQWKHEPMMLEVVRDIGTRAISEELSRISRELKLDDVHRRKY